jgi:hypothetical protein
MNGLVDYWIMEGWNAGGDDLPLDLEPTCRSHLVLDLLDSTPALGRLAPGKRLRSLLKR